MKRIALLIAAFASACAVIVATVGTSAATAATASGTPIVTTGPAYPIAPTETILTGSVDLNGASLAALDTNTCYFSYGTSASAETSTATCAQTPGSSGTTTVTADVKSLTAGQTYYAKLNVVTGGLVLGALSTTTSGSDVSFTMPAAGATPTATAAPATAVSGDSATLNASVNPENYGITSCTFSYGPSSTSMTSTAACANAPSGDGAQNVSANVGNLTPGTTYYYSLAMTYGTGPSTVTTTTSSFTTLNATMQAPNNVTSTSATLNATVNPEGQTVTACTFYYGDSATTLKSAPCSEAASQITGSSNVAVNANVTGLSPKTAYYDTVLLSTAGGGSVAAAANQFTTPATSAAPKATTDAATKVTATTATLNATVNAEGVGVKACGFEWGVNKLTASSQPGNDSSLLEMCNTTPGASGNQKATVTLKGLAPNTTYYYRILISYSSGAYTVGNTRSFKTKAAGSSSSSAKPGMKITSAKISARNRTASFKFRHTGAAATKGWQCALVAVTKGKAGKAHYSRCTAAGKSYKKLAKKTYIFYVRAGNKSGWGKAASRRFTI